MTRIHAQNMITFWGANQNSVTKCKFNLSVTSIWSTFCRIWVANFEDRWFYFDLQFRVSNLGLGIGNLQCATNGWMLTQERERERDGNNRMTFIVGQRGKDPSFVGSKLAFLAISRLSQENIFVWLREIRLLDWNWNLSVSRLSLRRNIIVQDGSGFKWSRRSWRGFCWRRSSFCSSFNLPATQQQQQQLLHWLSRAHKRTSAAKTRPKEIETFAMVMKEHERWKWWRRRRRSSFIPHK